MTEAYAGEPTGPGATPSTAVDFDAVKTILENAVKGDTIGEHGNFWRTTLDKFKALKLFEGTPREKPVLIPGDGKNSNGK